MSRIGFRALAVAIAVFCGSAAAAEVTVRNDSLDDGGSASIIWGFAEGEAAASWLTSPCAGELRAVQVFWRSPMGGAAQSVQRSIEIHRAGSFPDPGVVAETVLGPVLSDGVLNEWRYLDENNSIPLSVPLEQGETFVLSFTFEEAPIPYSGPSLTRDTDGIRPNRNAIRLQNGQWKAAEALGLNGDWVIRGVIDCQASPPPPAGEADVKVLLQSQPGTYVAGQPLQVGMSVHNQGPDTVETASVHGLLPAALQNATWTCLGHGGGLCGATSGNQAVNDVVRLPPQGRVVYNVQGIVDAAASGNLVFTVQAQITGSGVTDPNPNDNSALLEVRPQQLEDGTIFADGFEASDRVEVELLRLFPASATGWGRVD